MKTSALEYLIKTIRSSPDKRALSDTQQSLTFAQVGHKAACIAKALPDRLNQPVLVYLPKSIDAVIAFAGILAAGGCYVPIDIETPLERQIRIIDNLHPVCVVSTRAYEPQLTKLGVKNLLWLEDLDVAQASQTLELNPSTIDCDAAYIIFTSGSTGVPKGVVISHHSIIDYIDWAIETLHPKADDVIGNQAPFYFDNSTLDIYLSWAVGCELVVIPPEEFLFPKELVSFLSESRISWVFFVPSVIINVARFKIDLAALKSLKTVVFAGEVMQAKPLRYWQEHLPKARFFNLYGPTEITVDCTWFPIERPYDDAEPIPIGYPCRNTDILILDSDDKLCAPGEVGELCVRGSSLALGYFNSPEQSGEAFVQNPLNNTHFDRVYRTGDLARQSDGILYFVGRKDFQIKLNGYRIELGEIEMAAGNLPQIGNGVCLFDEAGKQIIYVYEAEQELPQKELRAHLLDRIPVYMCPRQFKFLPRLPMTPNGKVDRKELSRQFVEPKVKTDA